MTSNPECYKNIEKSKVVLTDLDRSLHITFRDLWQQLETDVLQQHCVCRRILWPTCCPWLLPRSQADCKVDLETEVIEGLD